MILLYNISIIAAIVIVAAVVVQKICQILMRVIAGGSIGALLTSANPLDMLKAYILVHYTYYAIRHLIFKGKCDIDDLKRSLNSGRY